MSLSVGVQAELALAVVTVAALAFLPAPYGRHARPGWGPTLPPRLGWALMESPSVFLFVAIFASGPRRAEPMSLALLSLWLLHYVHRDLVFPFRMGEGGKRMPAVVMALGFGFNVLNSWNNARAISGDAAPARAALEGPRLVLGAAVFLAGFTVNVLADRTLFRLRRAGGGYRIPEGALYRFISCPNYAGEIVEWIGWAIASWSPAGLAFAIYTVANLGPRALQHHLWYRERFADYPRDRKALVPFVL